MKNYRTFPRKFMKDGSKPFIHPLAEVSPKAKIGTGTKIWAFAQVREGAVVGKNCVVAKGAYIDSGVRIGDRVIVQDNALVYKNVVIEDDVFIGPGVCFTNDPYPRAITIRDLSGIRWVVGKGASIGANVCVLSEVNIGKFALVGSDTLVTKDVPNYGLVHGSPARLTGYVSPKGIPLRLEKESKTKIFFKDTKSDFSLTINKKPTGKNTRSLSLARGMDIDHAIENADQWLIRSGIQNLSRNPKLRGGVAAWYESDEDRYPYLYSEITGYFVSTLLFIDRIFPNKNHIRRARLAAKWLIDQSLSRAGGVKTRMYLHKHYFEKKMSFEFGVYYAFDTAIVGYGLLQLYKVTKDKIYLKPVEQILDFLIHTLKKKDGTFYPFYDPKSKFCADEPRWWSKQSGGFHNKFAMLFLDFFQLTGDVSYKEFATGLLDEQLKWQERDGRFITIRKDRSTYFHPHCYTLEGLLYAGSFLNRRDYVQAALRAFRWMTSGISSTGTLPSIYKNGYFYCYRRSDIHAQVLRVGSILYAMESDEMNAYRPQLENIKNHLMDFQSSNDHIRQNGGFRYGIDVQGEDRNHLNAWCTMFAVQSLWMYREFVENKKPLSLERFI